MAENSQGGWAVVGKVSLVIGVLLGLNQVYVHFIKTDVSVQAEGICQPVYLPGSLFGSLKSTQIFPTTDQVEKTLPEGLDDKYRVALAIVNVNSDGKRGLESAVENLKSIRSYCSFSVFNDGSKEAQDIKFELPREGIYFIERLGEEPKESHFEKLIPIGKLNPGGRVSIATWHQGYTSYVPFDSEHASFRITHTSGISEAKFLPQNTTFFGWFYERHPYVSVILFSGLLVAGFWVGISVAKAEALEKEKQTEKKEAETSKSHTSIETVGAPDTNPTSHL